MFTRCDKENTTYLANIEENVHAYKEKIGVLLNLDDSDRDSETGEFKLDVWPVSSKDTDKTQLVKIIEKAKNLPKYSNENIRNLFDLKKEDLISEMKKLYEPMIDDLKKQNEKLMEQFALLTEEKQKLLEENKRLIKQAERMRNKPPRFV